MSLLYDKGTNLQNNVKDATRIFYCITSFDKTKL